MPGWLKSIGANAMPLGLDLQGGVHFLMEVDQKAATIKTLQQRYVDDITRAALRKANIGMTRSPTATRASSITLKTDDDRKKAGDIIAGQVNLADKLGAQPPMELVDGTAATDSYVLLAKVRESTTLEQSRSVLTSNLTTLRNRVNQLGVAEPIVQQQGANRIVVELPGVQDTAEAKKIIGATATLEYRAVDETASQNAREIEKTGNVPPESRIYYMQHLGADGKRIPIILSKKIIARGDDLIDADVRCRIAQRRHARGVVNLNAAGGKKMLDFTSQSVGKRMGVVYTERIPQTQRSSTARKFLRLQRSDRRSDLRRDDPGRVLELLVPDHRSGKHEERD